MESTYESTIQQRHSHQWVQRLCRQLEMVHTVSAYVASFTVWSHRCVKTRQIGTDMGNFVFFDSAEATMKMASRPIKRSVYSWGNAMTG
jgi:hypothetical protein